MSNLMLSTSGGAQHRRCMLLFDRCARARA